MKRKTKDLTIEEIYELGVKYRNNKNYAEAEKYFLQCIKFPKGVTADMWNDLGAMEYQRKKIKEAEAAYQRATECDEGVTVEKWWNLSVVQMELNKWAEAEVSLIKVIELSHSNIEVKPDEFNALSSGSALEKAAWSSLKKAAEKIDGHPNKLQDFNAFFQSFFKDETNFEQAWANLNNRVAAYHCSDKDYSKLKAEASYKIVNTFHKGMVDSKELEVIRNKLDAPSLNLAAKAHIYYYVQCADRRAIVNDVYSVTDVNILQGKTALSANELTQHASEVKGYIDTKDIANLKEVSQEAINAFKAEIAEKLISK